MATIPGTGSDTWRGRDFERDAAIVARVVVAIVWAVLFMAGWWVGGAIGRMTRG